MKAIKNDEHCQVHRKNPVFDKKSDAQAYIDKNSKYSNQLELIAVHSFQKKKRIFGILSH